MTEKQKEKLLLQYQQKSDEIIQKMLNVVIRAQRKTDDQQYRILLEKIQQSSNTLK